MHTENEKISPSQLTFLMVAFSLRSILLITPGKTAGHDAWMTVIGGFGEGLIFILIYSTLAMRFPGKTPVQYNNEIFGSFLGIIVSIIQVWFLLHLGSLILRTTGDFFVNTLFPETPFILIMGPVVILCTSAVRNGIEVINRLCIIPLFLTILEIITSIIFLYKNMHFQNFFPMFDLPMSKLLPISHSVAVIPFGNTVSFLMVIPFLNNVKAARRSAFYAAVIIFFILFTITARNIAVLGPLNESAIYSSYEAVSIINIANIFTRLEVLVSVNFLAVSFLELSVLIFGTVLGTAQLFKLRSYLPLVFPTAIIILVLSVVNFENTLQNFIFAGEIWPYYSLPWQVGIPLFSLLTAVIRRIPSDRGEVYGPGKR